MRDAYVRVGVCVCVCESMYCCHLLLATFLCQLLHIIYGPQGVTSTILQLSHTLSLAAQGIFIRIFQGLLKKSSFNWQLQIHFKIIYKLSLVSVQTDRTLVASHNSHYLSLVFSFLNRNNLLIFLCKLLCTGCNMNRALLLRVGCVINKLNLFMRLTRVAQSACIFRGKNAQEEKAFHSIFY